MCTASVRKKYFVIVLTNKTLKYKKVKDLNFIISFSDRFTTSNLPISGGLKRNFKWKIAFRRANSAKINR